ncbi:MAG TPA: iron-sulfur cluster assembly protein [Bauldia sp.]|nr:iron-sulfur cluster assembly protein [Bauldia sp.]
MKRAATASLPIATGDPTRIAEVRAALADVTDPELDESVVDLDFIARIDVDGDRVAVEFRLPTFWCSANFAWIMAEDMRSALLALPWVGAADIRLVDHFAAERINAGVASATGFAAAFAGEATAGLAVIRDTFLKKAWLGRMARLIELLRAAGRTDAEIAAMPVIALRNLAAAAAPDVAAAARRYLALRAVYGGPAGDSDPAFVTANGARLTAATFAAHLRDIRMTRRGVEANGEMCRILLKGRYGGSPAR